MNQVIGWAFTAIVVLGIAAIALVAVWPRIRIRRTLDGAGKLGVRRLPKRSPEISRLADPSLRDLILFGDGCRITAAWKLPLDGGFAVTIRCKGRYPRPGGTTTKYWVNTTLVLLRPLNVAIPWTVQPVFDAGAAGRFIVGLIERAAGATHPAGDGLDPAFRNAFTVRGPGFRAGVPMDAPASPEVPLPFQELCVRTLQPGGPYPDLTRLMGQDGSLEVTHHGLALTLGQNASLGKPEDLPALFRLLDDLAETLAA